MKNESPIKAIRTKCLDCTVHQPKEVRHCPVDDCTLYPYRFGKNPNRKGIGKQNAMGLRQSNSRQVSLKNEQTEVGGNPNLNLVNTKQNLME
ncbi:MAG: hypothetical protein M1495_03550 [Bacteroidetes bacterium]|nr:hypothetical protein [Bacteroidota bacterium]